MIKKYERPDLEELELILEGSFLNNTTGDKPDPDHPGVDIEDGENNGEDWN